MHLARLVFLAWPCRTYRRGQETGGAIPWIHFGLVYGLAALGAGVGVAVALLRGSEASQGAVVGLVAGCCVCAAWFIYTVLVVVVLKVLNRPLGHYLGEEWRVRPRRWWDG